MKKNPSIHDIAKHLKVSATTVSFVLNSKAKEMRISDDVEKRVLDYVTLIGYQPNLIAKSLRTGKSQIIGMIVEDISDPFFAAIARGIESKAYKLGYKIFFASTENETEKARALIKVFRERQVDAYIVAPPPRLANEIRSLIADEKPLILFDRYFKDLETINVVVDNCEGTHKAIKYLQQQGFTNIGFVTLQSEQTQMTDRMKGYLNAIEERGQKKWILEVPYSMAEADIVEEIKLFLSQNPRLDSVLFSTNYLTLSGLEALKDLKMKVGSDLAIISFDDSPVFKLVSPAITAIAQPIETISEVVISKLMDAINNYETQLVTKTIVLPTELVIRDSAKALKN